MKRNLNLTVNFHLWQPCNMTCGFCFATFVEEVNTKIPKGHIPKEEAIEIIKQIKIIGANRINFAGGEPTLCPWLPELLKVSKEEGLKVSIITNGTKFSDKYLNRIKDYVDMIGISIDSLTYDTNFKIGRIAKSMQKHSNYFDYYKEMCDRITQLNIPLKINTVVSKPNVNEDFHFFLNEVNVFRWKVFQVLEIKGENDLDFDTFRVTDTQYMDFINRHKDIACLVKETNYELTSSYLMINPAGEFYDNLGGRYNKSRSINSVGIVTALEDIHFDYQKYVNRGGDYIIDK